MHGMARPLPASPGPLLLPDMLSKAIRHALQPVPCVALCQVGPGHAALALPLVLNPRAAVGVATGVYAGALAMLHVICPLACMYVCGKWGVMSIMPPSSLSEQDNI